MTDAAVGTTCAAVIAAVEGGDYTDAFARLESVLGYPRQHDNRSDFAMVADTAAKAVADLFPDAAAALAALVEAPDDHELLYAAGYALVENDLTTWALTLLERAHRIAPSDEKVLNELVAALEIEGLHERAVSLLANRAPELSERFMPRYLLAFNALMTGDLRSVRTQAPWLAAHGITEAQRFMAARIAGIVARADALQGQVALNDDDIRGWLAVISGGLVLATSTDEGRGRFATLDDLGLARAAIDQVGALLHRLQRQPRRVLVLDDPASKALGYATAAALGLPLERLDDGPGLVVAWFIGDVQEGQQQALRSHRPGQVLWSHGQQFTRPHLVQPDIVTAMVRKPRVPWGRDQSPDRAAEFITAAKGTLPDAAVAAAATLAMATRDCGAFACGVWRDDGERPTAWPYGTARAL